MRSGEVYRYAGYGYALLLGIRFACGLEAHGEGFVWGGIFFAMGWISRLGMGMKG